MKSFRLKDGFPEHVIKAKSLILIAKMRTSLQKLKDTQKKRRRLLFGLNVHLFMYVEYTLHGNSCGVKSPFVR